MFYFLSFQKSRRRFHLALYIFFLSSEVHRSEMLVHKSRVCWRLKTIVDFACHLWRFVTLLFLFVQILLQRFLFYSTYSVIFRVQKVFKTLGLKICQDGARFSRHSCLAFSISEPSIVLIFKFNFLHVKLSFHSAF